MKLLVLAPIAEINIFKYQLKFGYYKKLKMGLVDFRDAWLRLLQPGVTGPQGLPC